LGGDLESTVRANYKIEVALDGRVVAAGSTVSVLVQLTLTSSPLEKVSRFTDARVPALHLL
jgi:hypothetical protein